MWHGCVYIAMSLFHLTFFFSLCPSFLCLYLHFFHSGSGRTFKDKLKTLILMHKLTYSVFPFRGQANMFFPHTNIFLAIYIFITLDASHIRQLGLGSHLN